MLLPVLLLPVLPLPVLLLAGCGAATRVGDAAKQVMANTSLTFPGTTAAFGPGDSAAVAVRFSYVTGGAAPTGVVQYSVTGPGQDTVLTGTLPLSDTTVTVPRLIAGTYTVTAWYPGDANYAASNAAQSFTVNRLAPLIAVSGGTGMQAFASSSLKASVGTNREDAPPVTGSLSYSVAGLAVGAAPVQGSCVLDGSGRCLQAMVLPAGTWRVQWSYTGDANYSTATAETVLEVAKVTPSLSLTAAQSSPAALASDAVTAVLTGSPAAAPTGTIQWTSTAACADGSGAGQLSLPANTFILPHLCGGTQAVTGSYSGDANYTAVSASMTLSVAKLTPQFTLTPAQSTVPATSYDDVTASFPGVSTAGAAAPTGTIEWSATAPCAAGNMSGSLRLPASTFTLKDVCGGTYTVSATYSGDANYAAQASTATVQVNKLIPSFTLAAPVTAASADGTVPLQVVWNGVAPTQAPGGTLLLACADPGMCDPASAAISASSPVLGPFSRAGTIAVTGHYSGDDFYTAADGEGSLVTAEPFRVTVNQDAVIYPGTSALLTVSVAAGASSSGMVTVTASALPSDMTATSAQIPIGGSGTIKLTAGSHASSESFNGSDPGISGAQRSATLNVAGRRFGTSTDAPLYVSLNHSGVTPNQMYLPVLRLTTTSPVVDKVNYIAGSGTLTDASNAANNWSGTLTMKGHGNSTWLMAKKPYAVKLTNKAGLLGMAKAKSWILLANWTDKTLLRNAVAFETGRRIHMTWTPTSRQVELYLNGEYEGVYQLSEKVQVDPNRLNLTALGPTDTTGNALTGGYLMEIDHYTSDQAWWFYTDSQYPVEPSDPDTLTIEQEIYIRNTMLAADQAIFSSNFTDATAGWTSVIDRDSFVKWYLVNEFMGNGDAGDFWSSCFVYKDRNDPLVHMGPIWDFDISSGNVNYNTSGDAYSLWVAARSNWFHRLLTDPVFHKAVHDVWVANRTQFATLPDYVDAQATALQGAQQNNYTRWPTLGEYLWPNPVIYNTYQGEVDQLKRWLTTRYATLDAEYGTQ